MSEPASSTPDFIAIAETCRRMRRDIVSMVAAAGSGHPGGSLSSVEIVATLYGAVMRHDPARPDWPERDRFVLSKGHAAPVLYAALAENGYFPREELGGLRKLGSRLQGHPDSTKLPGVEVSTGSLGQGLAQAVGMALALRIDAKAAGRQEADGPAVFCLLGDGELQEGEIWEAAMLASHQALEDLVAIVDHNGLQIDGSVCDIVDLGDVPSKFAAFGWNVMESAGHSLHELYDAMTAARAHRGGPTVIVAATTKGKGVSFMEGNCDWHGKAPSAEETARALEELAG